MFVDDLIADTIDGINIPENRGMTLYEKNIEQEDLYNRKRDSGEIGISVALLGLMLVIKSVAGPYLSHEKNLLSHPEIVSEPSRTEEILRHEPNYRLSGIADYRIANSRPASQAVAGYQAPF